MTVRIQSIGRAGAILDALAASQDPSGYTRLRDITAATGLAKTTAFNLVTALADVGLVEHDARQGYRLGLQALVYGRAVERRLDLVAAMRPLLARLCAATRETVNLAVPGPYDVMIVDSMEGGQGLRVSSYAGTRASYHSTACGRALLAHLAPEVSRSILALGPLAAPTARTTTDPAAIEALLALCRETGFACEVEENEIGAACVAAPLIGVGGKAVAAISVAGPLARMDEAARARIGGLLVRSLAIEIFPLAGAMPAPKKILRVLAGADT